MTNKKIVHDDAGSDWAALSARLETLAPGPAISEFEVARLRRNVAAALPNGRAGSQHLMARLAVAVVAVIVGGMGLFTALDGARPVSNGTCAVQVAMTPDGNVAIKFHDGRTHRITKSDEPVPTAAAQTAIARGRTFVDRNGAVKPGEVTFYRID